MTNEFKREDITKVSINLGSNQALAEWQDIMKKEHGLILTYNALTNIFIQHVTKEAQLEGIERWMKKVNFDPQS
jgi:hypothetical protein